jgi:hypothetical protein
MPPGSLPLNVRADPGVGGREESSTGTVVPEARRTRRAGKLPRIRRADKPHDPDGRAPPSRNGHHWSAGSAPSPAGHAPRRSANHPGGTARLRHGTGRIACQQNLQLSAVEDLQASAAWPGASSWSMRPSGRGPSRKSWGWLRQRIEPRSWPSARRGSAVPVEPPGPERLGQRANGSPAVDGRGDPVEVWIVEAPLDEMRPFALESEAPVYEDDE